MFKEHNIDAKINVSIVPCSLYICACIEYVFMYARMYELVFTGDVLMVARFETLTQVVWGGKDYWNIRARYCVCMHVCI